MQVFTDVNVNLAPSAELANGSAANGSAAPAANGATANGAGAAADSSGSASPAPAPATPPQVGSHSHLGNLEVIPEPTQYIWLCRDVIFIAECPCGTFAELHQDCMQTTAGAGSEWSDVQQLALVAAMKKHGKVCASLLRSIPQGPLRLRCAQLIGANMPH